MWKMAAKEEKTINKHSLIKYFKLNKYVRWKKW